jgi:hypothetical protein
MSATAPEPPEHMEFTSRRSLVVLAMSAVALVAGAGRPVLRIQDRQRHRRDAGHLRRQRRCGLLHPSAADLPARTSACLMHVREAGAQTLRDPAGAKTAVREANGTPEVPGAGSANPPRQQSPGLSVSGDRGVRALRMTFVLHMAAEDRTGADAGRRLARAGLSVFPGPRGQKFDDGWDALSYADATTDPDEWDALANRVTTLYGCPDPTRQSRPGPRRNHRHRPPRLRTARLQLRSDARVDHHRQRAPHDHHGQRQQLQRRRQRLRRPPQPPLDNSHPAGDPALAKRSQQALLLRRSHLDVVMVKDGKGGHGPVGSTCCRTPMPTVPRITTWADIRI